MEINKILCPVDFSESSEQALKYATFLAWTTTRVGLCHNKQKRPGYVEG